MPKIDTMMLLNNSKIIKKYLILFYWEKIKRNKSLDNGKKKIGFSSKKSIEAQPHLINGNIIGKEMLNRLYKDKIFTGQLQLKHLKM